MANPNKIKVIYQPALKKIFFELYDKDNNLCSLGNESPKLIGYANKKDFFREKSVKRRVGLCAIKQSRKRTKRLLYCGVKIYEFWHDFCSIYY